MTNHLLPKARPARCASTSDDYCPSTLSKVACHREYKQPLTALKARFPPLHDAAILKVGSISGSMSSG